MPQDTSLCKYVEVCFRCEENHQAVKQRLGPQEGAGLRHLRSHSLRRPHYWRGCRLCQRWRCGLGEALAEN